MNEQEFIDYLRKKATSTKVIGVAKSNNIEDFFDSNDITVGCPKCFNINKETDIQT